jgi:hypothetical protein
LEFKANSKIKEIFEIINKKIWLDIHLFLSTLYILFFL